MTLTRLLRKDDRRIRSHASVALIAAATFLPCIDASPASALTIGLTRFGGCGVTPGACTVTVDDNGAGDLNPAVGTIAFSEIVGVFPDGMFTATGTLIENIARDASGRPVSIRMTLTDAIVQGTGGGIQTPPFGPLTLGQLLAISSEPLSSPFGVAGYASLLGAYEGFGDGFIGFSDISLEARLGGLLLGRVDPAAAIGVPAPVLFSGFDSRSWNLPVSNLLFGDFRFGVAPGDGFTLPASGEVFVEVIPEPATLVLFGSGLLMLVARRRRRA